MRNSDIAATIILIVVAFTTMILAICFDLARVQLWSGIKEAANTTGNYAKVNGFLIQMELVFWLVFLISLIGIIVIYVIGSHIEEGETYAPPQEYNNFNQ